MIYIRIREGYHECSRAVNVKINNYKITIWETKLKFFMTNLNVGSSVLFSTQYSHLRTDRIMTDTTVRHQFCLVIFYLIYKFPHPISK